MNALATLKQNFASDSFKDAIRESVPSTLAKVITPERITKIAIGVVQKNPDLLQCSAPSIMRTLIEASTIGLDINSGPMARAHMVPFYNKHSGQKEASLMIGYKGLLDLGRRAGMKNISADVVKENDEFSMEKGLHRSLIHKPLLRGDRGALLGAYAVFTYPDGEKDFEWMPIAEIEEVKKKFAKKYGPWHDYFEQMAKKTVLRRASNYWPMFSEDLNMAFEAEDRIFVHQTPPPAALEAHMPEPAPQKEAVFKMLEEARQLPASTQPALDVEPEPEDPKEWGIREKRAAAEKEHGKGKVANLFVAAGIPEDLRKLSDQDKMKATILFEVIEKCGVPDQEHLEQFNTIVEAEFEDRKS